MTSGIPSADQRALLCRAWSTSASSLSLSEGEDFEDESSYYSHSAMSSPASNACPSSRPVISQRGLGAATRPLLRYVPHVVLASSSPFVKGSNEKGYFNVGLSENKLMDDELEERLRKVPLISRKDFGYGSFLGSEELRESIRDVLARHVTEGLEFHPNCIAVVVGCGAIIHLLALVMCNRGESMLVLSPRYPAFVPDLGLVADVKCFEVHALHPEYRVTETALEEAFQRAMAADSVPRAILVTNPSNPIGHVYSEEELRLVVKWARRRNLFVVSDEIYAATRHSDADGKFISIAQVAHRLQAEARGASPTNEMSEGEEIKKVDTAEEAKDDGRRRRRLMGRDILLVWGVSKDLCLSGFRMGAVVTENDDVLRALGTFGTTHSIPRNTQALLAAILSDAAWVDSFVEKCKANLRRSLTVVMQTLEQMGVSYVRPAGGLYVWLDFGEFLHLYVTPAEVAATRRVTDCEENVEEEGEGVVGRALMSTAAAHKVGPQELEWRLFEDLFERYRFFMTPGDDFCPSARGPPVPYPVDATSTEDFVPFLMRSSAGFFRLCYASVSVEVLQYAMKRLSEFVMDKRRQREEKRTTCKVPKHEEEKQSA